MQIHQLLTCLSYGDAISNYALEIRQILRNWGYQSEIFTEESHPDLREEVRHFRDFLEESHHTEDIFIYHFSVGSVISAYLRKLAGVKVMIYHNITPQEYFIGIHPYLVRQIVWGRKVLRKIAPLFSLVIADSEFNKSELESCGYTNVITCPIKPSLENLSAPGSTSLQDYLLDGKTNILFVGRITPNKGHADLIKSFYFLNKSGYSNTRLIMVGEYHGFENYYWYLQDLCTRFKLDNVDFPGLVDYKDLISYYRTAKLFVCLSRHEGFCVPLVEAMYFHIPIMALGKTAVPYTMRHSGLVVSEIDYWKIAELMQMMLEDQELREAIVRKQDEVFKFYQSIDLESNLKTLLKPFLK